VEGVLYAQLEIETAGHLRELKRGNQSEGNGLRRDLRPEEEDDLALMGGSHQSVTERGRRDTRSGLS
jgi:hypothetical protein